MKYSFELLAIWLSVLGIGISAALTGEASPAVKPSYEPIEPIEAPSAQANIFLNAQTRASGQWSDRAPELAVNGNKSVGDHWGCENLPVWHEVVLKEPTELSAIRVWPYWSGGRVYRYKVEGSLDGENWIMLADQTANSIVASPQGTLFEFEPVKLSRVRTTFLYNSAGSRIGGHLVEIEGYASIPSEELRGGIGSIDQRYPPSGQIKLPDASEGIHLVAWRGERVNAQVVISSDARHQSLRFEDSVLRGPDEIPVQANFLRYTLADGQPQADIIDTAERLDLMPGVNRPVWVSLDVPADTAPGRYLGALHVRSDSGSIEFPIELEVLAARLPAPEDWQVHIDLWQHPAAVARWHDVPLWSDVHFALMKPIMRRLAEAGQKTITCAIIHEPWNGQTYDIFPSTIRWIKRADGSWDYDYSVFDRWVEFMSEEVGMRDARIHCYSMLPWHLTFRYYDEAEQCDVDAKLRPGSPEYDELWGAFLGDFVRHLKAKGWLERTRIAMDERPDAMMRGAMATLAKHAPELPIHSAINNPSELTRDLDDISPNIGQAEKFDRSILAERRAAGKITTFYVCTGPAIPNTFTFSPPAESEWLLLYASAKGLDGFLRWAYNSWVENPLVSTDYVRWPSGDTNLVYPGNRSSIRFERLRDGIENYEKIRLLREWAARAPTAEKKRALAELDEVLTLFRWNEDRKKRLHTKQVRKANSAILEAARTIAD